MSVATTQYGKLMVCNLINIQYADKTCFVYSVSQYNLFFMIRTFAKAIQKAKHTSGGKTKYGQCISQSMTVEISPSFKVCTNTLLFFSSVGKGSLAHHDHPKHAIINVIKPARLYICRHLLTSNLLQTQKSARVKKNKLKRYKTKRIS